jgi:DNA-binding CsgD family transcriptional regulator
LVLKTGNRFPYVFTHFKWSYLGIFAPQVWIYCVLHRTDVDYGPVDIYAVAYLSIALGMLSFVVLWRLAPNISARLLKWPPAVCAAAVTFLFVFPSALSQELSLLAAIVGGFSIAWMYLAWAPFYAKLDIRNAVACVFGAMAIGCALKVWIDLTPPFPATFILFILPLLSPLMLRVAEREQPPVDVAPQIFFDSARGSIPYMILLGVAVCSFIIGVSPMVAPSVEYGSFELTTVVHHGVEVLVAGMALWWVFCFNGKLHFTNLWRAILLITATGLLLLPNIGSQWSGWALIMIAIAQSLMVALLWAMLSDASHHSSAPPYVVFGFAWAVYALSLALGNYLGQLIVNESNSSFLIAFLTYALTLAAVFALNERNFIESRMFADLDMPAAERSMYDSIDEGCTALGKHYGLTDREVEIVELLCKGRSKSYIAETLFISENTVRSHSRHIYQKLDVHSKQEIMDMLSEMEQ